MRLNTVSIITRSRLILELVFISLFIYSAIPFNNNQALVLRICIADVLIFSAFIIYGLSSDKGKLKNILNPTIVFFFVFSSIQAIKNIFTLGGVYVLTFEIAHYLLALFILSYNFKKARYIETGLVLFIVYSFRIFDSSLSAAEFTLIHALSLILALHWLEDIYLQKKFLPKAASIFIPLVALVIIAVFSALRAVCTYNSLPQTAVMINFIFIAFLVANYVKDIKQVNLIIFTFFFIGGVLSVLIGNEILRQFLRGGLQLIFIRIWIDVTSPFKIHPNSIAGYFSALLCLIIGCLNFYKKIPIRVCAILAIVIASFILLLTYSRLGIFSFIFAFCILVLLKYKKELRSAKTIALLVFLIMFSVAVAMSLGPSVRQHIYWRMSNSGTLQTLYSCKHSLMALKDNLLFGWGPDNYYVLSSYAKEQIFDPYGVGMVLTRNVIWNAPHSLYLGIAFGFGVFGLVVFMWLLISIIVYFMRLNKYIPYDKYESGLVMGIFAAFIAMLIHGILAMTYHATILPAFFWVFVGLIVAIGNVTGFNKMIACEFKLGRFFVALFLLFLFSIYFVVIPIITEKLFVSASRDFSLGKLQQASITINQAKGLMPINPKFYELSAEIKNAEGLTDKAIGMYRQALALKPGYAFYHTRIGRLYRGKNMPAYALAEFKKALSLDKYGVCYQEHYSDLGSLNKELGYKEKAMAQFKLALIIDPGLARKVDWEGAVYLDDILHQIYQDYLVLKYDNPLLATQLSYTLAYINDAYRREYNNQ